MTSEPRNDIPEQDARTSSVFSQALPKKTREYSKLPLIIAKHKRLAVVRFRHARGHENGLKYLGLRIGWLAIFWLLTFLAIAYLDFRMLWQLLMGYLAMPVATQIKAEDGDLSFPDVTICPKTPFPSQTSDEDKAELENLRKQVKQKLLDANLQLTPENIQAAVLIQLATQEGKNMS